MPTLADYQRHRDAFLDAIDNPVLLAAGGWRSRNYPDNPFPYRPDSNFLLFFAHPEPDAIALFDPADRSVTLFLHERTAADALWHGSVPSFDEMKAEHGVTGVAPLDQLEERLRTKLGGRPSRAIAVADLNATTKLAHITQEDLDFYDAEKIGDPVLVQKLGKLRVAKGPEGIAEMRKTAAITCAAHIAAMRATGPGVTEQELVGIVEGTFIRHGCTPAYNTILSVRGEVLHNHDHSNTCQDGDIVLLDAGAENRTGYCSDITRSWPVSGRFTGDAARIYDIVLAAEKASIEKVQPGVRYRDIHLESCRTIAEGLVDMKILRGKPDDLVEAGAHALFFPHGVGHLIGLDVHDMEAFGDAIAYPADRSRSTQFGLNALRLDIDLTAGMCFTIEPGIYFVPAILRNEDHRKRFAEQVDFDRAENFLAMNDGRGFGGIRIEDDILCGNHGAEVLTNETPKERAELETLIGSA